MPLEKHPTDPDKLVFRSHLRKGSEMSITAMKQALEALEYAKCGMAECHEEVGFDFANEQHEVDQAIIALRAAIEQAQPVARIGNWGRVEWYDGIHPQLGDVMYSAPPPRQPLTEGEIKPFVQKALKYYGYDPDKYGKTTSAGFYVLARAIEAAHGIKGEA
jgi:hypothetical protein